MTPITQNARVLFVTELQEQFWNGTYLTAQMMRCKANPINL